LADYDKNDKFWNTTRIKSLNKDGKVRRNDGLPGYLNKEDYSLYYLSISSEGPLSLSFHSASGSRSISKKTLNLSYDQNKFNKHPKSKYSAYKSKKSSYKAYERLDAEKKVNNQQMNSHIAFIKMIFSLIDKQRAGEIVKIDCLNNLQLDNNIIIDLGFNSPEHFANVLNDFPTDQEGIMTEKEFIAFLLSQSNIAGENANNEYDNEFNNGQNQDKDMEADTYRQYNTEHHVTGMNDLNENSKDINTYNNRLTKDIGSKITNSRMSAGNKGNQAFKIEKDNRIKVSYKDFKDFTNQYKTKCKYIY
jgi:Ca2+-binding EF-hand superfamily protein